MIRLHIDELSGGEVAACTPELRWLRRNNMMHWTEVLQQKWIIHSGDDRREEWRDVPVVDENF